MLPFRTRIGITTLFNNPEEENQALRERVQVQQETIDTQQMVIEHQQHLIEGLQKQTAELAEHVKALQERVKKDSHNSHLPPSSDRFHRQPKSLRKQSGKQPGGQCGHAGNTLKLSSSPDLVMVHPVEHCLHCQHDLREVASLAVERRLVIDLPRQQCAGDRTPSPAEELPCLSTDQPCYFPRRRTSASTVWSSHWGGGCLPGACLSCCPMSLPVK